MEAMALIIGFFMTAIPVAIAIVHFMDDDEPFKALIVFLMGTIGICFLCLFSMMYSDRKEKEKLEKPKYELIQEPVYRKIK